MAPSRELLAEPGIAELSFSALVTLFLQGERTVVDVAAGARELAHQPPLRPVRAQLKLVGLLPFHAVMIALVYADR